MARSIIITGSRLGRVTATSIVCGAGSFSRIVGTTLALGGATIGANALAVTGTANISGQITTSSNISIGAGAYITNGSGVMYLYTGTGLQVGVSGPIVFTVGASGNTAISGTLAVTGKSTVTGLATGLATKTSNYTATATDHKILCDTRSGPVTITLPTSTSGTEYIIKDRFGSGATNNITIMGTSGELIDGSLTQVIANNYASLSITGTGTDWSII